MNRVALPSLSVVIPHFNHGRYVRQALDAMLRQQALPLEIFIIDDASTDGSRPLLEHLSATQPLVKVLCNDHNVGVAQTANRGLACCRGEYVYMAAADDIIGPNFFAKALDMAHRYPQAGMVYGQVAMLDEADTLLKTFGVSAWHEACFADPERFRRDHLEREGPNHSLCGATIYKREAFQEVGGYRPNLGHWTDTFAARAIGLRYGVCYVPEVFLYWRFSPHGVSGSSRLADNLAIVRRAAALMRSEPFCRWFPADHVARWERDFLAGLFREEVRQRWNWLRRRSERGGLPARMANLCVKALARWQQWQWQRTA